MKYKRGLFVGRFQPPHNGHLKVIEWILNRCEELIIVIGSAQKAYEEDNPFTAGERVEMLYEMLRAHFPLKKYLLIPVSDINNNSLWVSYINSVVPKYDAVFSNNSLTKKLFSDAGYNVINTPFFERKCNEGKKIREKMKKNKGWQEALPKEVINFIIKINGIERIKEISK